MNVNGSPIGRRLWRLEAVWPDPHCPVCLGRPHRIVTIDGGTDEVTSETMPSGGCLACGQSVYREHRLVVDHSDVA